MRIKIPPKLPNNKAAIFALAILLLNLTSVFPSQQPESLKRSSNFESISVKTLKVIPLPRGWHEGLFLDGNDIWVANGNNSGKVWVVDTDSGEITSDIEPVAGFTEAISRKKESLFFVTDWDEEKIYIASMRQNKLTPEMWTSTVPAHPAGVLWTGDRLFVITWTRGLGTKFNLLELDGNMKYIDTISIRDIQEPAHMAWDGKNLWITSWYNPLVYKIDIGKREILGAFRSPIPRTTGIVWDGKYLWLTGTYSGLYKMEICK